MTRKKFKYGILDDENVVVRWVFEKPSSEYKFVKVEIPKKKKVYECMEDALF